jgi:ABC-type methionine transport system ATPase subunit
LARAVYSSAQTLLLDDVLSALDVHTSRWIVEQCLAGDLLKGRTVLLVTHNVLLASSVADYLIHLNPDGTLQSHGTVERLLNDNSSLRTIVINEEDAVQKSEQTEEKQAEEQKRLQKGKQIVEEELAIGHVGWPVCESTLRQISPYRSWILQLNSTSKRLEVPFSISAGSRLSWFPPPCRS